MYHKSEDEYAFTLIELLVVIIIIGILAAIAIPAFLNQRQAANDGAAKSDLRNVVMNLETELIQYPNATGFESTLDNADHTLVITIEDGGEEVSLDTFALTEGVIVTVTNLGVTEDGEARPFDYRVSSYHENGKKYFSPATAWVYNSAEGGLVN